MRAFLVGLIPTLIFLGAMLFSLGILRWHNSQKKHRRSPLTRQLLRGPGQSLAVRIEDLSLDIESYAISLSTIPLVLYASYVSMKYYGVEEKGAHTGVLYITICILATIFFTVKLRRSLKERHAARLGLDCELAVGQELNGLMREGYRIYHDFPAANFNIDHIVVGSNGVFAVETKGRAKPNRKGGTADATVEYDGHCLRFPDWVETKFLDQAKRQATWLSKWLTDVLMEGVVVNPVLALPGWWIERKKRGDVLLLNGKDYRFIITQRTGTRLSEDLIDRISRQLEQHCRDVDPKAYNTNQARIAPGKVKVA